eukprot:970360-Rhodomonas_salina.1
MKPWALQSLISCNLNGYRDFAQAIDRQQILTRARPSRVDQFPQLKLNSRCRAAHALPVAPVALAASATSRALKPNARQASLFLQDPFV